jgi:hypothetical protein
VKRSPYAEKLLQRANTHPARFLRFAASGGASAVPSPSEIAKLPVRLKVREVARYLKLPANAVLDLVDGGKLTALNIATPDAKRPAWRISDRKAQTNESWSIQSAQFLKDASRLVAKLQERHASQSNTQLGEDAL